MFVGIYIPTSRLNFLKEPDTHLLGAAVEYSLLKTVAYRSEPFNPAS